MEKDINTLTKMIRESENIVFFGGAGVSTESGVPDYRSKDGLYNTVKEYGISPEEILSHDFFFDHTDVFYDFYCKYFITDAKPCSAHKAIAQLEKMGKIKAVITQNIDKLHQKAGSENVIELHGSGDIFYCHKCSNSEKGSSVNEKIKKGIIPRCDVCGGIMKPRVVLYGEQLYEDDVNRAIDYVENADMLIVGGTSLAVYPAASYLQYFKGKYIAVINKSKTSFDAKADIVIYDSIGKVFERVMDIL